ncbi:MAG: hypothetical protein JWR80_9507 [Bradyrhizobium sp.]|nr:hypothetical protein [Bradyrhizobium sp.]
MNSVPHQISGWLDSLPQNYVGSLFAKIKPPLSPFGVWFKVDGWGQLCDGRDHRNMVHLMLYNKFPFRGKGWTYVAWRSEPNNPKMCDKPTRGKVENPKPYSGVAHD